MQILLLWCRLLSRVTSARSYVRALQIGRKRHIPCDEFQVTCQLGLWRRVVIIGGGVIGAATAYYLSLRGVGATIVERSAVACAASGGRLALLCCVCASVLIDVRARMFFLPIPLESLKGPAIQGKRDADCQAG